LCGRTETGFCESHMESTAGGEVRTAARFRGSVKVALCNSVSPKSTVRHREVQIRKICTPHVTRTPHAVRSAESHAAPPIISPSPHRQLILPQLAHFAIDRFMDYMYFASVRPNPRASCRQATKQTIQVSQQKKTSVLVGCVNLQVMIDVNI
jgi:hypothetical protein